MKIPFDIKYKPQIESGEYKVETYDHHPVRIICWNKNTGGLDRIVALVAGDSGQEKTLHYTEGGLCVATASNRNKDLFIVTPEPEMTVFEKKVYAYCDGKTVGEELIKRIAKELLSLARDQFIKDGYVLEKQSFHDAVEKVTPEVMKEVSDKVDMEEALRLGYEKGRADALKDLPRWREWGNGAAGNSDGHPIALVSGAGGIRFVSVLGTTGEKYIMLADLKKLPGFKEDEK